MLNWGRVIYEPVCPTQEIAEIPNSQLHAAEIMKRKGKAGKASISAKRDADNAI